MAVEQQVPDTRRRWFLQYFNRLDTTGIVVAVLFAWASLTPTLLPRSFLVQGFLTGVCLISGYGIGVFLGWVCAEIGLTEIVTPLIRSVLRWGIVIIAAVGTVTMLVQGSQWQNDVRGLLDMPSMSRWPFVTVPVIAMIVAVLVLQIARGLRWLSRKVAALISRRLPPKFSRLVAVILVGWLSISVFSGVLWNAVIDGLEQTFSLANAGYDEGVEPPEQPERSGSAESLSDWDSLGLQGRRFVTGGPSVAHLREFQRSRGEEALPVREPIRAYAGLGEDFGQTADAVVQELDRTGAWDRDILVVATTTGTGWVDSSMSDAIELMHGGNTAIAAMQYSNLPSWLSFIGDQSTPPIAGRALFEAVYDTWEDLPEESRPRLILFGISLGAFGTEGAFSGVQDMASRSDGALLAGSPGFARMWRDITNRRDPGSPETSPIYQDGRTVRFMTGPPGSAGDPWQLPGEWEHPRIVFAQHATDGVTWWSTSLAWHEPDWLTEPPAPRVHHKIRWYPVVTFLQVTADLFGSGSDSIPMGHGHHFEVEYSNGFAMIAPPTGWTDEDTEQLRSAILARHE